MSKLKEKAFWIAAGDVAGRGFAFITSLYLASTLGPEYYGLITVAISVLGYATWFSDLGLISIGTRETAKEPEKRLFRVTEVFRTKVFLGFIVLVISSATVYFLEIEATRKQVILGYLFSIIPYVFLMEWFYSGKQEFSKIALSKVLNGIAYFVLVFFFVNSADDVQLVPVFYAIGVATASLTLASFAFREKPFTLPSRGTHVYRDLIKTSSLLGSGKFFGQMIQLLPPLVIGAVLSLREAGLYGAAFKIVIIAMMVDRVFVNLLLPNLSSLWSRDKITATSRIDTVYRLITLGGAGIAMIIAIASDQIIGFLFTEEYNESIILLQLLSVLIAVTFINSLFSFGLIATNKDRAFFKAMFTGGLIGGLVIIGMTYFGNTMSAAASVSIAEIIITGFTLSKFRSVVQIPFLKPILICFPVAFGLFLISLMVPLPGIINALIAAMLYVFLVLRLNLLEETQMNWIKNKLWS